MVIVAVVDEHALLHDDLLFRIASVEDAEGVVGETMDVTQRTEGTRLGVARLPVQHQNVEAHAHVVLDPALPFQLHFEDR